MIFSKTTPFMLLLCLMLGGCASVSVSRQEWGNNGSAVSTELVAAIRTKEGGRKEWTAEELLQIP